MSKFKVSWHDGGLEPTCKPDPKFPNGRVVVMAKPGENSCAVNVPYPARRCGSYLIVCERCGMSVGCTTAGRLDDPRRLIIPCQKPEGTLQ